MVFGKKKRKQSTKLSTLVDTSREEEAVVDVVKAQKAKKMWNGFRGYHKKHHPKKGSKRQAADVGTAAASERSSDEAPWDGNFDFDVNCLAGEDGDQSYEISLSFSHGDAFHQQQTPTPPANAVELKRSTKSFRGFLLKRGKSLRPSKQQQPQPPVVGKRSTNSSTNNMMLFDDIDETKEDMYDENDHSNNNNNLDTTNTTFDPFSKSMDMGTDVDRHDNNRSLHKTPSHKSARATTPVLVSPSNSTEGSGGDPEVDASTDPDGTHVYKIQYTESFKAVAAVPSSQNDDDDEDEIADFAEFGRTDDTNTNTNTDTDAVMEDVDDAAPTAATVVVTPTKETSDGNTVTSSFTDNIPLPVCSDSFVQIFKCVTSLSEFEKLIFATKTNISDSLGTCGRGSGDDLNKSFVVPMDEDGNNNNNNNNNLPSEHDFAAAADAAVSGQDNFHLVDMFLSQATKTGIPLTFYQPKDSEGDEWESHAVNMYVTPGRRDERVCVPPMLMWVSKQPNGPSSVPNPASCSTTSVIYNHFDLSDIDSVLKPDDKEEGEEDNNSSNNEKQQQQQEEPNDMEQICFSVVTTAGDVFLFEAGSSKQRDYVVDSLELVISRLAFV